MKNSGVKIKIRRELLSPESIYKHQNYSNVLKRHERKKRFQRALKLFIYSLLITVVVLFLVVGSYWVYVRIQKEKEEKNKADTSFVDQRTSSNKSY